MAGRAFYHLPAARHLPQIDLTKSPHRGGSFLLCSSLLIYRNGGYDEDRMLGLADGIGLVDLRAADRGLCVRVGPGCAGWLGPRAVKGDDGGRETEENRGRDGCQC